MKKAMKIAGIVVGSFIGLVIVLIGASLFMDSPSTIEEVDTHTASATETNKEDEAPKDKVYKVGDVIKVDGIEITLTSAKYTPPAPYSEEKSVLTVELTAKNKAGSKVYIDNTDFKLYSKDGVGVEEYYSYDENAISSSINQDREIHGKLFYAAEKADEYELIFTPSYSSTQQSVHYKLTPQ